MRMTLEEFMAEGAPPKQRISMAEFMGGGAAYDKQNIPDAEDMTPEQQAQFIIDMNAQADAADADRLYRDTKEALDANQTAYIGSQIETGNDGLPFIDEQRYADLSTGGREEANELLNERIADTDVEGMAYDKAIEGAGDTWVGRTALQTASDIGATLKSVFNRLTLDQEEANRTDRSMGQISAAVDRRQENELQRAGTGAISSVAKALAASPAGAPGVIGTFVYDSASRAYSETGDLSYALTQGAIEGVVTSAFQKVGLGGFEKGFKGWSGPTMQGVKNLTKQVAGELAEEEIIGLTQAISSQVEVIDPEALKNFPDQAWRIALQTVLTMGAAKGIGSISAFVERPTAKNADAAGIPRTLVPTREARQQLATEAQKQLDLAATQEAPIAEATESPVDAPLVETATEPSRDVTTQPEPSGEPVLPPEVAVSEQASTETPADITGFDKENLSKPEPGEIGQIFQGLRGVTADNLYEAVQQSLETIGEVPAAERNSYLGQAWSRVKGQVAPDDFIIAVRAAQPSTNEDWQTLVSRIAPKKRLGRRIEPVLGDSSNTPPPSVAPVEQPVSVPPAPVDSRVPEKKRLGKRLTPPPAEPATDVVSEPAVEVENARENGQGYGNVSEANQESVTQKEVTENNFRGDSVLEAEIESEQIERAADAAIKKIYETGEFNYTEKKNLADRVKGAGSVEAVQAVADEAAAEASSRAISRKESEAKRAKEDAERLKKRRTEARTSAANAKYWKDLAARSRKLKGKKGEAEVTITEKSKPDSKEARKAEILTDEMAITYVEEGGDGGKKTHSLTHIPTGLAISSGTQPNLRQLAQLIVDSGFDLKKVKAGNDSAKQLAAIVRAWDNSDLQALPSNLKEAFSGESKPTNVKADLVLDGTDMGAFGGVGLKTSGLERIKKIASAAPEFAYEPVFTVNDKKQLVYKDGVTYTLDPALLNLHPSELTEGQTVGINLEDIGLKQLTAGQAVVQSLKNWGFNGVRQKPNGEIVGKWGDHPVSISGADDKWQVADHGTEGSKKAAAQATQALKKMHFYQETPPVPKKRLGKKKSEDTAVLGAGKGGPLLQPASPRVIQSTPKSQREIITDLAKALKVPIRFGRLRTKHAGYFLPVENLIAAAKANDIPIVSHEVGHKIDTTYGLSKDKSIASELDVLGDPATPGSRSSWTKSKTRSYKMGEGMAEFVRYWLTDPAKAKADAPNTHAVFEQVLDANKDLGDTLRKAQEDIRLWRTAEPQARLRSQISIGENPNKTPYSASQLTRDLVDDLHYLKLATQDAKKGSPNLPPSKDPYLLARNLRGSYGMAETFIRNGAVDFNTKDVDLGTSLEDALKPVGGRINDFRDWIIAKRAQELHKRGIETGLVPSDVNAVAKSFDGDQDFENAFKALKKWNNSILNYAVDSGLVTKDGATAIRKMNQDYVPFHRLFEIGAGEDPSNESTGKGSGLNPGKPGSLKRLKGSTRNIVDPLETMVKNAYAIITASEKAAISNAVADMAKLPNMGKWVEQVARPMKETKFKVDEIRQQLEDMGADLSMLDDDMGQDDVLSLFRAASKPARGENTISVIRNGNPEFYRLNRYLHDTFEALDLDDAGKIVKFASAPANLLRAGVVLDPDYNLANAIRDAFSSAVVGKYTLFPFETTIKGMGAILNNPKLVAEWAAAGGKSSIEAAFFDRKKMQEMLKERISKNLTPAEQATVWVKSPLALLRQMATTFEEATRIGEYQNAFKALTKSGMPEGEARRLAAFEARDRQDFAKGGAKTKILRRLAAFWNAGVQGGVRFKQSMQQRPVETTLKGLAWVTIPTLLEQAINWDDEDYWDRPWWERAAFWLIPKGEDEAGHTTFWRIPKPPIIGAVFGAVPQAFLAWAKENRPDDVKNLPMTLLEQSVPNPTPQTAQLIFEVFQTGDQGWSVFTGRPIVPDSLSEYPDDLQWTEQTSTLAKKIGENIGYSPMKIDHMIASTTGGLGKLVTGRQRLGKRFTTTPLAVSGEPIQEFYEIRSELKEQTNRLKATGESEGLGPVMLADFEEASEQISALRDEARAATDPAQRAKIDDQAYQIAKGMVESYRSNPEPTESVSEYATKAAKYAHANRYRPVQKTKRHPGRDTPIKVESDEDYQKRLDEWESRRDTAAAWLSKHSDSPIVKAAVSKVKVEARKRRIGKRIGATS